MQLHEIKPIHKIKKKKRIGRGGKRGTYCGKGVKGQKARAGAKIRPELRDLIKKIPKLRGYKFSSVGKKSKKKRVFNKVEKGVSKRNNKLSRSIKKPQLKKIMKSAKKKTLDSAKEKSKKQKK